MRGPKLLKNAFDSIETHCCPYGSNEGDGKSWVQNKTPSNFRWVFCLNLCLEKT